MGSPVGSPYSDESFIYIGETCGGDGNETRPVILECGPNIVEGQYC